MALTDTALKALKPRLKAYVVSDDRSLYAEVLPSGAIVWRFRYRLNGKREKLTLGKYPALTLKNARLKRDEAAQLVAMGESPAQKKQRDKIAGPEDTTVAQFAPSIFHNDEDRSWSVYCAREMRGRHRSSIRVEQAPPAIRRPL